jgi:hypothetical protein
MHTQQQYIPRQSLTKSEIKCPGVFVLSLDHGRLTGTLSGLAILNSTEAGLNGYRTSD